MSIHNVHLRRLGYTPELFSVSISATESAFAIIAERGPGRWVLVGRADGTEETFASLHDARRAALAMARKLFPSWPRMLPLDPHEFSHVS